MISKEEQDFLKSNNKILKSIFQKYFDMALEAVLQLPPGPEKDGKLYVVQEYRAWLKDFENMSADNQKAKEQFI